MGFDLLGRRALAEARHVLVLARTIPAPAVIGVGDAFDIGFRQLTVNTIDHRAKLAGVDEQGLALAVAHLLAATAEAVLLVAREEPQADRDLSRVEELAR